MDQITLEPEPKISRSVVLKREPLGSLREEFIIRGRKFVPGKNWRGKAVGEKTLNFYCYVIQHIKITTQRDCFRWGCLHNASTSCFINIAWASSFSPLLFSPGRDVSFGLSWYLMVVFSLSAPGSNSLPVLAHLERMSANTDALCT